MVVAFMVLAAGCDLVPALKFVLPDAAAGGSAGDAVANDVVNAAASDAADSAADDAADDATDGEGTCDAAGDAGILCCGTTKCIDRQDPLNCSCGDCLQMGCHGGDLCCFDLQGTARCAPNAISCK